MDGSHVGDGVGAALAEGDDVVGLVGAGAVADVADAGVEVEDVAGSSLLCPAVAGACSAGRGFLPGWAAVFGAAGLVADGAALDAAAFDRHWDGYAIREGSRARCRRFWAAATRRLIESA